MTASPVIRHPARDRWPELCSRPVKDAAELEKLVTEIFDRVVAKGDAALRDYTRRFDGIDRDAIALDSSAFEGVEERLAPELCDAMRLAHDNIHRFHTVQTAAVEVVETAPGVRCWRKSSAISPVGFYIPGGSAPLFSTILMLGVPARIAGCERIVLCTPPNRDGTVHPAMLYAAKLVGIREIYLVGGAQAVAAMALGTESIPAVRKLFGPGNQYVDAAKRLAVWKCNTAIDMSAAATELVVIADRSSVPRYVAADLLSQAEHGPDSQVVLLAPEESVLHQVYAEVERQKEKLPRAEIVDSALKHARWILVHDLDEAVEFANHYAPEHLILAIDQATAVAQQVRRAGSVFLGHYAGESFGDYASGTNHTLPTCGGAGGYSGGSVDSFVTKITYQEISRHGVCAIAPAVIEMATEEGLDAHANAARIRLQDCQSA